MCVIIQERITAVAKQIHGLFNLFVFPDSGLNTVERHAEHSKTASV